MSFTKPVWFEKLPRTIAKAVTWRSWMMITNSLIGWIVTGDWMKGLVVGLMALVINSILYICHERLWNRFDWKKVSSDTDKIVL